MKRCKNICNRGTDTVPNFASLVHVSPALNSFFSYGEQELVPKYITNPFSQWNGSSGGLRKIAIPQDNNNFNQL